MLLKVIFKENMIWNGKRVKFFKAGRGRTHFIQFVNNPVETLLTFWNWPTLAKLTLYSEDLQ